MFFRFAVSLILVMSITDASESASALFSDGGDHPITSVLEQVFVNNGTTVDFQTGSAATGEASAFRLEAVLSESGSHVIVSGGVITGGERGGSFTTARGAIESAISDLTVIDGSILGGLNNTGRGFGGDAVKMFGGHLSVMGGLIKGGDSNTPFGGDALDLSGVTGSITGGTIEYGDGPFFDGALIKALSGTSLDIRGGSFQTGGEWVISTSEINVFGTDLVLSGRCPHRHVGRWKFAQCESKPVFKRQAESQ